MGVDFSHGDAHFGHGSFHSFRRTLATMVCVRLDDMRHFGGHTPWETVADPIAPLLWRNDAGGELTPEEARGAAARLEELMAFEQNREQVLGDQWESLLAGLKEAAEAGEPFVIMG
ncbi:hypothetical protein V5E97_04065 [Singulisphaera sp. Ch08]|uniref:DUF1877 family protein n=1 Tax=Singulisphaera sp. Ch08 TaxID=3120278 RepID=A0AAU7CJ76_9BACT